MLATTNYETNFLERAAVYRLLARLWKRELCAELLAELSEDNLRSAYESAGGFVPCEVTGEQLEELSLDYCQLFIGPSGHLPPYQSVWDEGCFEGTPSASLREYVQLLDDEGDWSVASPLDHLAVQLDMMGFIVSSQNQSDANCDHAHAIAVHFFHDHIAWAIPLCQAAHQQSCTEFYRKLTHLTREFIEQEQSNYFQS